MVKKRQKKHIALNTHLWLCVFLFLVFLGISISFLTENEIGFAIIFLFFTLLSIFGFLISPLYFVFSKETVEIVYRFRQREMIRWREVRNIAQFGSWIDTGRGLPHYVFAYPKTEKRPFFVVGEIPKTRRTKKLIKMFYKGDIF